MGLEQNIAANVARLRKEQGLSQGELADKGKLKQTQLSLIEGGKKLTVETLEKLAIALNVPAYELLKDPNEENQELKQKLEEIERLPISKKKALTTMIDVFLRENKMQSVASKTTTKKSKNK